MKKRRYSDRTEALRKHRRYKNQGGSYFFIRANICLGIIICALGAAAMEDERISEGCERVLNILSSNTDREKLKADGVMGFIKGNTYTFAGEKSDIRLSEEIEAEIEKRSGVYEQNNKGAPQRSGFVR